jgi:hypothetical protein
VVFRTGRGPRPGDILLAQKIALETMERKVLALANSQTLSRLVS